MSKLVFAGFARLRKDLAFWICFLGMLAMGAYAPIRTYQNGIAYKFSPLIDGEIFGSAPFICMVAAVFISLYLGVDYSDGTIRNKMMVGRTRSEIYMANWVVCVTGSLLLCLAYTVPATALSLLLLGPALESASAFVTAALLTALVAAVVSSIYVLVSMLCQNKAITAVGCLVIAIALFIAAMMIINALSEPPTLAGMVTFSAEEGMQISDESVPNPAYLTGTKRAVYEFFNDFLPVNQGIQCNSLKIASPLRFALCGLGIILASISGGLWLFSRKDLK